MKKEKKEDKDKGIFWFIIIAVIAIFYFISQQPAADTITDTGFLSITMYDAAGNIIKTTNTGGKMSTVTVGTASASGVASIGVTARVTNTGSKVLTCSLTSITNTPTSPTLFNAAMNKSSKSVAVGNSITWTTATPISVASFEGQGAQTFSVSATCTYVEGATIILPVKSGSFIMTVTEDGAAAFSFSLDSPVLPSGCGNGICDGGETTATCAIDCPAAPSNVKFRTQDNTYALGSAIGVTSTCGNDLTGYGYYSLWTGSGAGTPCSTACIHAIYCPSPVLMYSVPGAISTSLFTNPIGTPTLYDCPTYSAYCVCQIGTYNSIANKPAAIHYRSSDPDASKVSTSAESTSNPSLEVGC